MAAMMRSLDIRVSFLASFLSYKFRYKFVEQRVYHLSKKWWKLRRGEEFEQKIAKTAKEKTIWRHFHSGVPARNASHSDAGGPEQKFRHGVSSIKEYRFAIFMTGVFYPEFIEGLARHKIAKHDLDFPDFLNQWFYPSLRSLRPFVQDILQLIYNSGH